MSHHYSIVIQWSDEDQAYLVILPEFGAQPQSHGSTYEEAITNAQEVLELLIETYQAEGWKLPEPVKFNGIDSEGSEDDHSEHQQPQPAAK